MTNFLQPNLPQFHINLLGISQSSQANSRGLIITGVVKETQSGVKTGWGQQGRGTGHLETDQITGLRLAKWKWGRKWELSAITKCLCDSGG